MKVKVHCDDDFSLETTISESTTAFEVAKMILNWRSSTSPSPLLTSISVEKLTVSIGTRSKQQHVDSSNLCLQCPSVVLNSALRSLPQSSKEHPVIFIHGFKNAQSVTRLEKDVRNSERFMSTLESQINQLQSLSSSLSTTTASVRTSAGIPTTSTITMESGSRSSSTSSGTDLQKMGGSDDIASGLLVSLKRKYQEFSSDVLGLILDAQASASARDEVSDGDELNELLTEASDALKLNDIEKMFEIIESAETVKGAVARLSQKAKSSTSFTTSFTTSASTSVVASNGHAAASNGGAKQQQKKKGNAANNGSTITMTQSLPPISVKESVKSVVEYLRTTDRIPLEIISREGMQTPFVARENTMSELQQIIMTEVDLPPSHRMGKYKHIPLLAAPSGFGKTRTLLELRRFVKSFNEKNLQRSRHMIHLYVTYNKAYGESAWEVSHIAADILLAWRMIYFYFSPPIRWRTFLKKIKVGKKDVLPMDLFDALAIISDNVRRERSLDVAVVVCVDEYDEDEYQPISVAKRIIRLKSVIRELSTVMYGQQLYSGGAKNSILVPIFAGLSRLWLQEAAFSISVRLPLIPLEPLDYDSASEIVRSYTGNSSVMLNKEVRDVVSKLSAVPGYLVDVMIANKANYDWGASFFDVCFARGSLKQGVGKNIETLVAYSVTGTCVPESVCAVEVLDVGGFCWFRDIFSGVIGVPFSVMYVASRKGNWQSNVLGDAPTHLTYVTGIRESLALLCSDSADPLLSIWRRLALLRTSHMALLINSLGLISDQMDTLPLSKVLEHAYTCSSASNIRFPPRPIAVRSSDTKLHTIGRRKEGSSPWELGECLMMGPEDQETVDSYMVFRDCSLDGRVFDLLFFEQCNGLVPATYDNAVKWCRDMVLKYEAKYKGRSAGFMLGVTNPIKMLSQDVRDKIDSLGAQSSSTGKLEFYYGMGRNESIAHYSNFVGHPVLAVRVYINEEGLSIGLLADALPDGWSYPQDRATKIVESRPIGGYKNWEEVALHARIKTDKVNAKKLYIPKTVEETAVRFD